MKLSCPTYIRLWNEFTEIENILEYSLIPIWNEELEATRYAFSWLTDVYLDEEDIYGSDACGACMAIDELLAYEPIIKRKFEAFLASRE